VISDVVISLFTSLPLLDHFPFELVNGRQNVELQAAIHGGGVDPLVQDNQVHFFYLKLLDNASQVHHGTGQAI
jgi:hypothetical protein